MANATDPIQFAVPDISHPVMRTGSDGKPSNQFSELWYYLLMSVVGRVGGEIPTSLITGNLIDSTTPIAGAILIGDATTGQYVQGVIDPASNKISIALADGSIEIDAVEANFTLDNIGGTLNLAKGGTNASLVASVNSLVYSTASSMAFLATANNGILVTSGTGVPSISGTLPFTVPINKGGTGQITNTLGFNALSPLTTKGDLIGFDGTNNIRTAVGSNTFILTADSTATTGWKWAAPATAGTVTTVSVVTANGVSGTVANATTTPAITLTLGAITPTSVNASSTVTGSNLTGTNTGDQTITLTGNVTGSGTSSFATTIAASAVTNAMLAGSIAFSKLIGTDITKVGTLTNGTWQATVIDGTYINYNATNLKVTTAQLNTIQDITTSSAVQFGSITVNGSLQADSTNTFNATTSYNVVIQGTQTTITAGSSQRGLFVGSTFNPTNGATTCYAHVANPSFIAPSAQTITRTACFTASPTYSANVGTISTGYIFFGQAGTSATGTLTNAYCASFTTPAAGTNKCAMYADHININVLASGTPTAGTIRSAPPSSDTATGTFGTSLTAGTALQNSLNYDVFVNIDVAVTSATAATITLGVGSTSTPTVRTAVQSFTTAALTNFGLSAIVPAGYYLLVGTTGTIVVGSITTVAMPI